MYPTYSRPSSMIVNRNNCQFVLISWDCQTELPQTCWLQATERYSFTVLEARSQNQGVSRTMLPLKAVGGNPSLSLAASGRPRRALACRSHHFHVGLCHYMAFYSVPEPLPLSCLRRKLALRFRSYWVIQEELISRSLMKLHLQRCNIHK